MPRTWIDGRPLEVFDEYVPVLNEGNPEVTANRLLGEAFRICHGTLNAQPRREHLQELLAYAQAYIEVARGDGIETQALARRCERMAVRLAELEANALAAGMAERTVRRLSLVRRDGGEAA